MICQNSILLSWTEPCWLGYILSFCCCCWFEFHPPWWIQSQVSIVACRSWQLISLSLLKVLAIENMLATLLAKRLLTGFQTLTDVRLHSKKWSEEFVQCEWPVACPHSHHLNLEQSLVRFSGFFHSYLIFFFPYTVLWSSVLLKADRGIWLLYCRVWIVQLGFDRRIRRSTEG